MDSSHSFTPGMGPTLEATLCGRFWTTLSGRMVGVNDLGSSTLILEMGSSVYPNPPSPGSRSFCGTETGAITPRPSLAELLHYGWKHYTKFFICKILMLHMRNYVVRCRDLSQYSLIVKDF